ncbi:MAG TPA: methionine--tRNA ligase [Clostridiales bacterium]|nr:methionine--tRNA ligase [Clostridiales bacterium]
MKNNKNNFNENRPIFPKRAVITAGMPYGNKELHFGHVGGMFVHADTFARFLRDRIGKENVIFVSGTDCYGSPIMESYNKLVSENEFKGTIEEYVLINHILQKEVLENYEINLNLYATSALGKSGSIHNEVSKKVFETLYDNGYLRKISTPQFFDPEYNVLLNGRQVVGRCPIQGCQSEHAYADECSLGHQYMPSELIDPKSILSGKKPVVKNVLNWYFDLESCSQLIKDRVEFLKENSNVRKYILNIIEEFLKPPAIYVQKKLMENRINIEKEFPIHKIIEDDKKTSITYIFNSLKDRDSAREILECNGIHYRTGKTLVPFRISGNIKWGVPIPDTEDMKDLTFWVWPESLWAPISFTKAYLSDLGRNEDEWKTWWCEKDSEVYQFIGEDNIYFYGVAETALFTALGIKFSEKPDMKNIHLPHLISNYHILFMDKKASSSSDIKPPTAKELLNHYTAEQLRMHFLSLGLATKSVSFKPQVYMNEEEKNGVDTVLKEGNLLTNVFNRLIRSCFYTLQAYYDSKIPNLKVSESIYEESINAILLYEKHMYNHEFHSVMYVLDDYIRNMNKYYVNNIKIADKNDDIVMRKQILVDCFHAIKTIAILLHPIAPSGCEMIRKYLNLDERIWNWDNIFKTIHELSDEVEYFDVKFLEPKIDFFKKHECQL